MKITDSLLCLILSSTCVISGCDRDEKNSDNISNEAPAIVENPVAQQVQDEPRLEPMNDEPHTDAIKQLILAEGLDPRNYQVLADTEGDLNEDGLADKVIAIQNKEDKTEEVTSIVLLKKQDSTFQKDSTSRVVIPPELTADDTPLFDSIALTIENSELVIAVSRFTGNTQSHFRYLDEELTLTKIEQYAFGAGEHYSSSIDLLNSTLEETRTNTMDETMPSETTTTSFHLPVIYFAKADPEIIIEQALKGHQKQTINGVLVSGGGIDDNSISIQTDDGNEINAYCDQKCGDWFVDDAEGNTGGHLLNSSLKGKRVSAVIATEISNGRIAGPGDDDELVFIKEIEFIEESTSTSK